MVQIFQKTFRFGTFYFYKKLDQVDLNKPIEEENDSFDAVIRVGTFTFGHVKPPALTNL